MTTLTNNAIFPIFQECSNFTLDSYWKDMFINCSHNKFPSGLKYDGNHKTIMLRIGKKMDIIGMPADDPIQMFRTMMSIFKDKLGLTSTIDVKKSLEQFEELKQKKSIDLNCDWKKIKPRTLKKQLLMNYVESLATKHNLQLQEIRQLISIIHIGFQFKSLTSDSVEYSDGVINSVYGLQFDEVARKFTVPVHRTSSLNKTEKNNSSGVFFPLLDKFIRDDNSRIAKLQ